MPRLVAFSLDKKQAFIYEAISAQIQERQTEKGTLKAVVKASRDISEGFFKRVGDAFGQIR